MAPLFKIVFRLFVTLILAGAFTFFVLTYNLTFNKINTTAPRSNLVENCQIPKVDPFDKSIKKFIERRGQMKCEGKPSITYEDGKMLRINWNVVNDSYDDEFDSCVYQPIIRGTGQADFSFILGNTSERFRQDVQVDDEFIKVYCFNGSDCVIYKNFHVLMIPKEKKDEMCEQNLDLHRRKNEPKEILSVLMVGVDSVSRLNSVRQMPLMRKYLLEDLEAIEMEGYTKVADNTFVNVIPILTGKFVEELPWNETLKNQPFDKYNFIWKNFSQAGYRTLYAEDAPYMSAFTYGKAGFSNPPTDYYPRAFTIAMEQEESVWFNNHWCVGDRLEMDILLKYVKDFANHYHSKPHFAFTFITRPTHDDVNSAGAADDPHYRFLRGLDKENILKNTVLVYFSDHGIRFGDIRNTYVGKVEERMPFLFFAFPKWFKKKYPKVIENMKINAKRLTTPFDLHETLKTLLYFKAEVNTPSRGVRGISLSNEIPRDRSCDDAAIMPQWCTCLKREKVSTSSKLVQNAASVIMHQINNKMLGYRHQCEILEAKEIQTAVVIFRSSSVKLVIKSVDFGRKQVDYQLTLLVTPGGGIFEATVTFDETNNNFTLAGDISRINKYGNQSFCISDFVLKKYCFCK